MIRCIYKSVREDEKHGRHPKAHLIIHGVYEEECIVYHTHGLKDYGSLELELNLSLPEDDAMIFLNIIGLRIANGT